MRKHIMFQIEVQSKLLIEAPVCLLYKYLFTVFNTLCSFVTGFLCFFSLNICQGIICWGVSTLHLLEISQSVCIVTSFCLCSFLLSVHPGWLSLLKLTHSSQTTVHAGVIESVRIHGQVGCCLSCLSKRWLLNHCQTASCEWKPHVAR